MKRIVVPPKAGARRELITALYDALEAALYANFGFERAICGKKTAVGICPLLPGHACDCEENYKLHWVPIAMEALRMARGEALPPVADQQKSSSSGLPPAQAFAEGQKILKERCPHERSNEDGICRRCGEDRRGA